MMSNADNKEKILKRCGLYEIVNTLNGKKYFGSTNNTRKRWELGHRAPLMKGNHPNQHLQNAWNKYGEDAFVFVIIGECPIDMLQWNEQIGLDIIFSDPDHEKKYYNISRDAWAPMRGRSHKKETKEKHRQAQIKRFQDPAQREKQRQAQIKRWEDPAQREKTIKRWEDPAEREKHRQSQIKRFQDPAQREKQRQGAIKKWKDPAQREQAIKKMLTARPRKNNKTGFRGVSFHKRDKKFQATIKINGKAKHLGFFLTAEEAAHAWDKAARETWGPEAFQNFRGTN